MENSKKHRFFVDLIYNDNTSTDFYVELEGKEHEIMALLDMITRGTLRASSAYQATAYRLDGFPICSYINR